MSIKNSLSVERARERERAIAREREKEREFVNAVVYERGQQVMNYQSERPTGCELSA